VDVTVLGPQRRTSAARTAVRELMPDGPIATINAGWQEREAETDELNDVLGGRMRNLELHRRWHDLTAADPDYASAERRLNEVLSERQQIYAVRLGHELAATDAVRRRSKMSAVRADAEADAIRSIADLDRWHLRAVGEARAAFYAETGIGDRGSVADQRAELAELVASSAGLIVAGGHVGVLLHVLHIFGLAGMIKPPVITWSAGAMALSDRVVLFHHEGPPGRQNPEVFAEGLGAFGGVLPFPHPRRRLHLNDAEKMRLLARRFAPWTPVLLSDGVRVDLRRGQPLPAGSRWIDLEGHVIIEGSHDRH
jgi:hypothetical protein